jgi:hypothetical protein
VIRTFAVNSFFIFCMILQAHAAVINCEVSSTANENDLTIKHGKVTAQLIPELYGLDSKTIDVKGDRYDLYFEGKPGKIFLRVLKPKISNDPSLNGSDEYCRSQINLNGESEVSCRVQDARLLMVNCNAK